MLPRIFVLSMLLAMAGLSSSHAQEITLLTDTYVQRLNEKALPVYKEGIRAHDRINYDRSLALFYQTMRLDPKHIKLRLMVGRFALERGKMKQGEEALKLLNQAQEAYSYLLTMDNLKPEDRRRAETDLQQTRSLIAELPKRDTRREATGLQIIQEVAKEREEGIGLAPLGITDASEDDSEDGENGEGERRRAGTRRDSSR